MLNVLWMIYCWGVSASLLVGVPKSILEWNYIRRKNRKFFKEYNKAGFFDKLLLQLRGMSRCFIPFYNIIHPFRSLAENSKYRMDKHEAMFYKAKPNFGKKISQKTKGWWQNVVEFFAPVKDEEELTPEKKPEVKPEKKPEVKPEKKPEVKPEKKPETPVKKPTMPASTPTSDLDKRIALYKEEYYRLRGEYDALKARGASVTEINAKVAQMRVVTERYNALKAEKKSQVVSASEYYVPSNETSYTRVLR